MANLDFPNTEVAGVSAPAADRTKLLAGEDGKLYVLRETGPAVSMEERKFPPGRLVAAGDSITANQPSMPTLLVDLPAFAGSTVYTVAQGGWPLQTLIDVYPTDIYPHRPAATGEPAYLFVRIGTNDFQTPGLVPADYVAELEAFWQGAKDDGFTVFAHTVSGREGEDSIAFAYSVAARYEINNLIRKSQVWDYLIDVAAIYPNLADTDAYADGVHPPTAANQQLAYIVDRMCSSGATAQTTDHRMVGFSAENVVVRNSVGGIDSRVNNVTYQIESTEGSGGRNCIVKAFTDWSSGVNGGVIFKAGGFQMLLLRDDIVVLSLAGKNTTIAGTVSMETALPDYANNAAAITGGLAAGRLYRNGDSVNIVH